MRKAAEGKAFGQGPPIPLVGLHQATGKAHASLSQAPSACPHLAQAVSPFGGIVSSFVKWGDNTYLERC